MKNFVFLFMVSLLLFGAGCKKDNPEVNSVEELETFVEEELSAQNIPAISLLIFKEGNILYEGLFGESNVDQNLALADDHLFLLASVSKTVTATALMQLYDQGEFGLDDKINDYLSFSVSVPGESTDITFRMLLTHTSGIADGSALDGQYYYGSDSPVALDYFLENYLVPGGDFYNASENFHNFEPGTEHEYSNEGSALIAVLVEQISGVDFNTYCKQNIFTPLGMEDTFWRLDEINQTIVQPYTYTNGQFDEIQHYTFTDYPNGGLRSTAKDLFTFFSAFAQNGRSNNHQLLQSSTVAAMLSPQIPDIDAEVGLHMFLMDPENDLWGHDGGEQGVATIMAFNKSTKVGAIVLSNEGEADLDEILKLAYQLGTEL